MNGLIAPAILVVIVGSLLFFYILHHKEEAMADEKTTGDKKPNKHIMVHGYYLETKESFSYRAMIGEFDESDEFSHYYCFYWFDSAEKVIGTHDNEFHIHSYEEISHD